MLQVGCVIEMLTEGGRPLQRTVRVISLGLEAETMASMINSSIDSVETGVKLVIHKSPHPARIAGETGTSVNSVLAISYYKSEQEKKEGGRFQTFVPTKIV